MAFIIAVWGVAPGIGKSTLCRRLAEQLSVGGRVDHFAEEDVLSRPEFAAVATEFRADRRVDLDTLVDATARYAESARGFDISVADALLPYVPTALAMGHSDAVVTDFCLRLREALAGVPGILVFLDGDPRIALRRAADREGPRWLDWYVEKLAGYGVEPRVTDVESAIAYLRRERTVLFDAAATLGWGTVTVDAGTELDADQILANAIAALAGTTGRISTTNDNDRETVCWPDLGRN